MSRLFPKATVIAQQIVKKILHEGDYAVDATAGNGNDTLFMARLVGDQGHVYSFDIQTPAIGNTKKLLDEHNLSERVTLIQTGHENLDKYVKGKLKTVMFNLGYLPGGDHNIITIPETTVKALNKALDLLDYLGVLTVVVYSAHQGATQEQYAVEDFFAECNRKEYDIVKIENINYANNPPFVIVAQKIA